jgi:hypothetical protein
MSDIDSATGWVHVTPDITDVVLTHRADHGLRADTITMSPTDALRLAQRLIAAASAVLDPTHTKHREV